MNHPRSLSATGEIFSHWSLERDDHGIFYLTFNRVDANVNTLNQLALYELNVILTAFSVKLSLLPKKTLSSIPALVKIFSLLAGVQPLGLVIRSGKTNGFIAGADITEFAELQTTDDA